MYRHTLVEDVQKVIEQVRRLHGEFTLAMLYNNALDARFSWNLIVAAPWLDQLSLATGTRMIVDALYQNLKLENKGSISRVTVLKTTEPFVQDMTSLYPVSAPGSRFPVDQLTAGELSGSGVILYSQAAA